LNINSRISDESSLEQNNLGTNSSQGQKVVPIESKQAAGAIVMPRNPYASAESI